MAALDNASYAVDSLDELTTVDGLRHYYSSLSNCDPAVDTLFAETEQHLVATARLNWSDQKNGLRRINLMLSCHPDAYDTGAVAALLDWAERRGREINAALPTAQAKRC